MNFTFFLSLLVFVSLIICLLSKPKVGVFIPILATASTTILCIVGVYYVLPFGGADGLKFEQVAWDWSQGSLKEIVSSIDGSRSYVISSIVAIFYHFMGRDVAIPIFINGILGVLIFYFSLILAQEIWGKKHVNRLFALLLAIHPVLNVHSATMLRENYIVLFIVLASISLAKYANKNNPASAMWFLFFVLLSSFFHGGMILYIAGLPLFMLFGRSRVKGITKIIGGVVFTAIFAFILTSMDFGKLSDIQQGELDVEYLAQLEADRQQANTAYLVGMAPSGLHDIVWQAPIRSLFLLAKPFPWDVRSLGHLIVMLDAALWWSIIYLVWKHRSTIKRNPAAFAILLSCLITIVAFAYGTSNFGTGVRHRTKFVVMALALVSPFLPRVRFALSKR